MDPSKTPVATPTARRPWWRRVRVRLSVRALMIVVLIVGAGVGWVVHRARVQREAIAAIVKAGGKTWYDWQVDTVRSPTVDDLTVSRSPKIPGPRWLVDRLGLDYFGTVKMVMIPGPADAVMPAVARLADLEEISFVPGRKIPGFGPTDVGMAHLQGLASLRHLNLGIDNGDGTVGAKAVTGEGIRALAGAADLQILQLQGIPLKDADLAALRGLTSLRILEIDSPDVTDEGLAHLAGLVELRRLRLQGTKVTSAGIGHLAGMSKLVWLDLAASRVDRLEPFRPLASLEILNLTGDPIVDDGLAVAPGPGFETLTGLLLANTQVGDSGLTRLPSLPALKRLNLTGTDATDVGVAEFQKARPNVRIIKAAPTPPGAAEAPARARQAVGLSHPSISGR